MTKVSLKAIWVPTVITKPHPLKIRTIRMATTAELLRFNLAHPRTPTAMDKDMELMKVRLKLRLNIVVLRSTGNRKRSFRMQAEARGNRLLSMIEAQRILATRDKNLVVPSLSLRSAERSTLRSQTPKDDGT